MARTKRAAGKMSVRERREHEAKKAARLAPISLYDDIEPFWARVFQFVGSDSWAFVALVSKRWHAFYRAQVAEHPIKGYHSLCAHARGRHLDAIGLTSRKAAFASPSRVQLANELGMPMDRPPDDVMRPAHDTWPHVVGLYGTIESLDAAHKLGMPWDEDMCSAAARRGSLPLLTWLRSQGCPWNDPDDPFEENVGRFAAERGHVDMLKFIKAQGEQFDDETVSSGMQHMPVIEYFLSEGIDLAGCDSHGDRIASAATAASAGDLAALQYARTHNFEWTSDAAVGLGAAQGGSVEVLNWLTDTLSIEWSAEQLDAMLLRAGVFDKRAAAAWLLEQGAEWPDSPFDDDYGKHWPDAFLTWAQEQGCELADIVYQW
jgi:hypothetical protein